MGENTTKILLGTFETLVVETRRTNDKLEQTNVGIADLRGDIREINALKADKEKIDEKFEECKKSHEKEQTPQKIGMWANMTNGQRSGMIIGIITLLGAITTAIQANF